MKIVFMTPCANGLLRSVVDPHRLVGVATDDAPPGGAAMVRWLRNGWHWLQGEVSLFHWAARRGIPCHHYHRRASDDFACWLRQIDADLLVTCKAPLLPEEVFNAPRYGAINIHYSLLPNYRGGSPLLWQVVNGESHGGVTIHRIDSGIDTGPILRQAAVDLPVGASARQLDRLLGGVAAQMLPEALDAVFRGESGQRMALPSTGLDAPNIGHPSLLDFIDWRRWPLEKIWRVLRFMEFWPPDRGIPAGWRQAFRWQVGRILATPSAGVDWRLSPAGRNLHLETRQGGIELLPRLHLPTLIRAPLLRMAR